MEKQSETLVIVEHDAGHSMGHTSEHDIEHVTGHVLEHCNGHRIEHATGHCTLHCTEHGMEHIPRHNVKLCVKCSIVKDLHNEFYRAGKSWQKYCKSCHNKRKVNYVKKQIGFMKLPDELKKNIVYSIYIKKNIKTIYAENKEANPNLNYQTLLRWYKLKQIPEYKE